ncbi:hypothetical protein B9Z55_028982 [Caenorhabditis nigoni]|uniref:Homeobox domain-containing protein n=1 Tax=Caenorhabditis nigoni TaxID=1611254 RepID=A0A2G5S928_9PELO|nr:hypothetical protein B9Z55_028982 [Caenorhabditis nigoni]
MLLKEAESQSQHDSSSKAIKKQINFTTEQKSTLSQIWRVSGIPDQAVIKDLAKLFATTERKIKDWFYYQRRLVLEQQEEVKRREERNKEANIEEDRDSHGELMPYPRREFSFEEHLEMKKIFDKWRSSLPRNDF